MTEEANVQQEDLNLAEDQASQPKAVAEANISQEEFLKAKEIGENQRLRAEKAERELKALKRTPKEQQEDRKVAASVKEQILEARALNDVHEEDVEEIADYAERKGISLREARKNPYIQAFLKTRSEERTTASVSNTGSSKRNSSKETDDTILENARKGVVGDSKEDIEKLVLAQISARKKKS